MIIDKGDHILRYSGLSQRIADGLTLLNEKDLQEVSPGKYNIDGENLFYIVNEYQTQPVEQGLLEVHHTYLDIQYIVSGCECIGYAPSAELTEQTPYDAERDVAFYNYDSSMSRLILNEGMFAIFWPNEAHMPGRIAGRPESIKKIVIKVRMEQ